MKRYTLLSGEEIELQKLAPAVDAFLRRALDALHDPHVTSDQMIELIYGRENPSLTDELLTEAPGIFNWCLEGLSRLTERGHFVQPQASRAAMQHLEDLASPVSAFLRDCCTFHPEATVGKDELWTVWKTWAEDAGAKKGTKDILIRDLRAARPQIRSSRPTIGGKRVYMLTGLRIGLGPTIEGTPDMVDGSGVGPESVRGQTESGMAQPSRRSGVSGVDTYELSRNGNSDEDEARWRTLFEQADDRDPEDIPL